MKQVERHIRFAALGGLLACAGCSTIPSDIPIGADYMPVPTATAPVLERYEIGPADTVSVSVYREPELSVEQRSVDPAGYVNLPLIGSVKASGRTAAELSSDVAAKLAEYVIDPKVSIDVASATQTVAVEGSVNQPGIFAIPGRSSLIEALALAQSPTELAALDQVIVFRNIDGQRAAARFDLRRVRAGLDPDPVILPGDRIVVGYSGFKEAWLQYFDVPIFNIFRIDPIGN